MKAGLEIREIIERELLSWPDVTVGQHRFGGREFRVGKRELRHLHGSAVADLPFPRAIRDELVSGGKASPHHHLPNSGWVSFYFRSERIHRIVQSQRGASTLLKESSRTEHESNH
jgi:luciferase-like monooxygenase